VNSQDKIEFLKLYEPVHNQLSRFCRAISGNPEDGEDLLQDTILNCIIGFKKIKDRNVFKSYMFSIASNLHKMKLRRQKYKADFNDAEINQIADFGQDQEYLTDFKIVYEKMLSLPERMAETLILFHISDLSLEEIQKIQGGSLSGVKLRLKRGREKLLSLLNTKEQMKVALMLLTF
jgi:RNA polymerase sigma-70 factor (ECF subfamily)